MTSQKPCLDGGRTPSSEPVPTVRTILFEGIKVHYDDYGVGTEALVFLHGWACNVGFWQFQIPAFADRVRTIAIDFPGHGASEKPEVDYTEDLFARSVMAVLEDAGVERAVFVGHSMGTPVERTFYQLAATETIAMVFVDGALRPTAPKEVTDQEFAALDSPAYDAIIPQIFGKLVGSTMEESLREWVLAEMLATPKQVVISAGRNLANPATYSADPIDVPVLAVMAKASNWPPDNEAFYRSVAPKIDYQEWDGTSHFVMLERPDDLNAAIAAELDRIDFPTSSGTVG